MAKKGRWPGTWRAICDRCGFEFPSDMLRKDWMGLMVCDKDFEIRHPQDFVRGVPDDPTPPWTRPEPADVFVSVNYIETDTHFCTAVSSACVADYGTAGCMTVGRNL